MSGHDIPQLSVVVATLDRCEYLRLCLEALGRQTAPAEDFEVIVVDNGSSDETVSVATELCGELPNVRYVREERRGLSVARNTGVAHSRAAIVAFTDDDAMPHPAWADRIIARFETLPAEVAVLGGEVEPIWEAPRPDWLIDPLLRPLSAGLMWGPTARLLRDEEWLVEVNIAYRRARLLEFGGFAEQLGRVGTNLMSGEGCINQLMARAGLRCFYDPQILVRHHIPAARLTRSWFRRRYFWQGASMNMVAHYVDSVAGELGLHHTAPAARRWEEIVVPASAAAWADLFDDRSAMPFGEQIYMLEQLGYLLQSQSILSGR
jgi:glycosyltransferase involved in cell wall biosynthesis